MLFGVDAKFARGVSGLTGREVRLLRVGKGITSPFRQIADAIQASQPHDRIEIESGKYFETLTLSHPIELCSAKDGEPPVIISRGPSLTIRTDGPVLIQSLAVTAKGSRSSEVQGVVVEQGSPIIRNCEVSSIYVSNDAAPQVLHCQIQNSCFGYGLSITGNSSGTYANNDISYHNAGCIHINTTGKPDLHFNRITQRGDQFCAAVHITGRLLGVCEPFFRENIIRGGEAMSAQDEMDPTSVHSPQMLAETNVHGWTCLVCVEDGAVPFLVGNLLCNGVSGFCFWNCNIPVDRFRGNRIVNCVGWGIVAAEGALLCIQGNDIHSCGGGIHVYTNFANQATSDKSNELDSTGVIVTKCDLKKNIHYGILINSCAVTVTECNISESNVGIALLGNCADCTITKNVLTNNSVTGFSITHHGVATIANNTISSSSGNSMYGIMLQQNSCVTLVSNVITGTATSVYVRDGSSIVAEKNAMHASSVHHVVLVESSKATLKDNTIEGSVRASVVVTDHSECTAHRNIMYSGSREGILVEKGGKASLTCNNISSMEETIYVKSGGYAYAEENDVTLGYHGIVVEGAGSNCIIMKNNFSNMRATAVYALEQATVTARGNSITGALTVGFQIGLGAKALLENNTFTKCTGGAIHIDGFGTKCQVLQCRMESVGYGIWCTGRSSSTIQGNQIQFCKRFGVSCELNESVDVYENKIFGATTGMAFSSSGESRHNTIEECEIGVLASVDAVAVVKDHKILNCNVGLSLETGTCITFRDTSIQQSKQFGVVVHGPCVDVKVRNTTIEESGVAGVCVRAGGACSFEECVLERNRENGIQLEQAGAVVFKQCMMNHQRRAVMVTGTFIDKTGNTHLAQLVNCTIDGGDCEEGVVCYRDGMIRLEFCRIHASCAEKGGGIIVHDGGGIVLSHCDIIECPGVGITAAPTSHVLAEYTSIYACRIGLMFTSPGEDYVQSENCVESTTVGNNNSQGGNGNQKVFPKCTQLMIKDCTETGIYYESHSCGVVSYTTVEKCATGVLVECGSHVVLQTTAVSASTNCGIVICGPLSRDAELSDLTISDSGNYGLKVTMGDVPDAGSNPNTAVETCMTIESTEITRNAKGGAFLFAPVSLEKCTISHNSGAGVVCEGNYQPLLKKCYFEHNKELHLEVQHESVPDIQDCVLKHAPIGVRVQSALHMRRCIIQQLDVGVAFTISDSHGGSSSLSECVFAGNSTCVSSSGETSCVILMEKCVFSESVVVSVCVEKGPQAQLYACRFESSTDAIGVMDAAEAVIDGCSFGGNMKGISMSSPKRVEVKNSTFLKQIKSSLNIIGNYGDVRISGNSFSGGGQYGIFLSTEGIVVLVSNNIFEEEHCGVFAQDTPQIRMYNNRFFACQTGVILSGSESLGRVFSNVFDKNKIGCRCEQGSSPQLWRNVFEAGLQYGILSITGAIPVVVENIFDKNLESGSAAVCVRNGGIGHFALNRYTNNLCAICLEDTGETVFVNNSLFLGNTLGIQIREGAAVYMVGCTFADSLSGDIQASGRIEQGRCIIAYNSFASKRCAAVTVSEYATLVLFRCLFFGADGKGLIEGDKGRSMVFDCLFYELPYGVIVQENGNGSVVNSVFIRCTTAVEVCAAASPIFYNCLFLGQPKSKLVVVNTDATPLFQLCNFVGGSQMLYPLLYASGGGLVQDSSFSTGHTAVVLDDGCTMTLRKNTFLLGSIGIALNQRSQGKVEKNIFYNHSVTAVKIMENASGELRGNAFEQPLENGAILAATHNVLVEACQVLDSGKARPVKKNIDEKSTESQFVTVIVDYLRAAPYWARRGMSETPCASILPASILAVMSEEEEEEEKAWHEEEITAEQEEEQDGGGTNVRDGKEVVKKTEQQKQERGGKMKANKTLKKTKPVEDFFFTPSNTINSVPKNVQDTLLAWVNHHDITLSVERPKRFSIPRGRESSISIGMLKGIGEEVSATTQFKRDRQAGTNASEEVNEIRGANTKGQTFKNEENEPVIPLHDLSHEETRRKSPVDILQNPLQSPVGSTSDGASPSDSSGTTTTANVATSKLTSSSRPIAKRGEPKSSRSAKQVLRKRRRNLPPPLQGTAWNAKPHKPPHRDPLSTVAGCLRVCNAEALPQRKPRRSTLVKPISISVVTITETMESSATNRRQSLLLNSGELDTYSEGEIFSGVETTCMSKASSLFSVERTSVERKIRSREVSGLKSSLLSGVEAEATSDLGSSGQQNFWDSQSVFSHVPTSPNLRSLVKLTEDDEVDEGQDIHTEILEEYGESRPEQRFVMKNKQKKADNDDNDYSRNSSLFESITFAGETQRPQSKTVGVLRGINVDTKGNNSLNSSRKNREFSSQRGEGEKDGEDIENGIRHRTSRDGSVSRGVVFQVGAGDSKSATPERLSGTLKGNEFAKNLLDEATGKTHSQRKYKQGSGRQALGEIDRLSLESSSLETLQLYEPGGGSTLGNFRKTKGGPKSVRAALPQYGKKKKKETLEGREGASPTKSTAVSDQVMKGSALSVPGAREEERKCVSCVHQKIKKGVTALSKERNKATKCSEIGKELGTSLDQSKTKPSVAPPFSSGESGEKGGGAQEQYLISKETWTSSCHPAAAFSSSPTQIVHQEGRQQGKEELSKGVKDSSQSDDIVHLPKISAPLDGSVISRIPNEVGASTGEVLPVALSTRGYELLEQLQQNVLSPDAALQTALKNLRGEAPKGKRTNSFFLGTVSSGLSSLTPGVLSTISSWDEDADVGISEKEQQEEMEDIIIILRWLADMRQKRLLGDNRFYNAVESIRENTNVSFFFCEGNTTGGAPTLIVRLPQAADEAVVIPLLEDTPLEVDTVMQHIRQEYGENTNVQPRTIRVSDVLPPSRNVSMVSGRRGLPLLSHDAKGESNMERGPLSTPAVSREKKGRSPMYMAYARVPRGHLNGPKELPDVLAASLNARRSQQTSPHFLDTQDLNGTQDAHPYRKVRLGLRSNAGDSHSLPFSNTGIFNSGRLKRFDPAAPQESSPYNKSPEVASYIATGTKNFMV